MWILNIWLENPSEFPGEGALIWGPNRCVLGNFGTPVWTDGNRKWRFQTDAASVPFCVLTETAHWDNWGPPSSPENLWGNTITTVTRGGRRGGWGGGGVSFSWQLLYKNDENNDGISLKSFFIFIFVHICEYLPPPRVKRWNPAFLCWCWRGGYVGGFKLLIYEAQKLLCMV